MDPGEALEMLVETATTLQFSDRQAMQEFKEDVTIVIRRVFGESHRYLNEFNRLDLYPLVLVEDCRQNLLRFLNKLAREIVYFGPPADGNSGGASRDVTSNRVFIVHGHDEEMKQAVARAVEKLGLEAVILHEQANEGKTIIEKVTASADVKYAIVLLSPDDVGFEAKRGAKTGRPRARQNVIFELGFFTGLLGRQKVVALCKGEETIELPSDHDGVLYIAFDKVGKWRFDIARELRQVGFGVDANRLM